MSEITLRTHSLFYCLFEVKDSNDKYNQGEIYANRVKLDYIYDMLSNTETLIYLLYTHGDLRKATTNQFLITLVKILIISSLIVNTQFLLSNTYVFDPTGNIDPDNQITFGIFTKMIENKTNYDNTKKNVVDFVDLLVGYCDLNNEINVKSGDDLSKQQQIQQINDNMDHFGSEFGNKMPQTLENIKIHFKEVSQMVNTYFGYFFPEPNGFVIALGIMYTHFSDLFNYFAEASEEEEEEDVKEGFIEYMITIVLGNKEIPDWYLAQINTYNERTMIMLASTPSTSNNFIDYTYSYNWFAQSIAQTTSEPNLWNDATRNEFSLQLQSAFVNLNQKPMPSGIFEEIQTQYKQITSSFQVIRRLGVLLADTNIQTYATTSLRFDISQLSGLIQALNTVNIQTILQAGAFFSPLLNKINEAIKSQQDAPGLAVIALFHPKDTGNVTNEEAIINQFVQATGISKTQGGKNRKIKNIKINTKKTKKQYKKIIKKQGTKMIKKQHKQNKKITRKPNNKK